MGHSLVCSISSLRKLGVARFKLTLEVALTANSKVKGARKPELLYFVKLMIIVLNCQHKNPMNPSIVKAIACNHGLPQIFQKVYLASSSRKENEGALKSQNCLNRLWRRHLTSTFLAFRLLNLQWYGFQMTIYHCLGVWLTSCFWLFFPQSIIILIAKPYFLSFICSYKDSHFGLPA